MTLNFHSKQVNDRKGEHMVPGEEEYQFNEENGDDIYSNLGAEEQPSASSGLDFPSGNSNMVRLISMGTVAVVLIVAVYLLYQRFTGDESIQLAKVTPAKVVQQPVSKKQTPVVTTDDFGAIANEIAQGA